MKYNRIISCLFLTVYIILPSHAQKHLDLQSYFEGYRGCFVLYDMRNDTYARYNETRCEERLSPCSTFKIPNSLIGLETGVIVNEKHRYKWDGVKRSYPSWNQDHTLRTAIANSVVWYYQKLASEIGEKRMQEWVNKIGYGNKDISGGLIRFWLGSSLKISANEQIEFLKKLYKNDLPFSQRSMDIVKDILILSKNDRIVFRGKTGSGIDPGIRSWGWFVGYVENNEDIFIFAANIEGNEKADGRVAKTITENILKSMNVLR